MVFLLSMSQRTRLELRRCSMLERTGRRQRLWLDHNQILDVACLEDDVFVDIITSGDWVGGRALLGSERANLGQSDRRVVGVDGVEDSLVADVQLGDQTDLASDVRSLIRHDYLQK
ncbi:hypothetical protein GCK72_003451 [Caenorhabditis remanei]|uniref:Uncharacterized protein n=1 Tax=Caenorhabditis remanei TaxID=31234 RepID=A0A6A5HXD3_CAERE|nr:hypothetical protein GCK72_003451 [Caenorhabditis remanei]KAF1771624.1 hypothetical protein GCK72_003451 [Caenorhabditis remanei]